MAKDINIKIKSDSKEAENGIKKVTSQLNSLSKDIKKSDVAKFAKSFTAVTAATAGAVTAIKKANAAIKETTQLYRNQITAEKQLETAAKNNPYLNSSSVQQLKEYASYLQSISTTGDEELLPYMAQLASAGRTQTEIQKIMSAALDVSASGMMSLDAAVTQLNKTYSGQVGLLGNQITDLKTLTSEQLKNGDAVKIVAEKFKGMAEETAKATGSTQQLKNAIGDMKEEIGAAFEKKLTPMRRFFTELVSGWTSAAKARREYEEADKRISEGTASTVDYEKVIAQEQKLADEKYEAAKRYLEILTDEKKLNEAIEESGYTMGADDYKYFMVTAQNEADALQRKVNALQAEYDAKKKLEEANKSADEEARKQAQLEADQAEKNRKALALKEENQKALDKQIEQITLRAKLTGEEVDQQEILNAMIQSYIALVTTDNTLVTENNELAKQRLAEIEGYAHALDIAKQKAESNNDVEEDTIEITETLADKYERAREEIQSFIDELSQLDQVASQIGTITKQATNLINDSIEDQAASEMASLEKQYDDGLLSYEEFCDKKKEINKKAAQEEYKLKMWEWHASLLTATANVAQGVSKAIAENGYPLGIIMGSLAAVSGALEIATITRNRPVAPSFATGGIVPGNSYTGDNVHANVNSGEMILNASQQAQLWSMANGNRSSGAGVTMPITINNNSSAQVNTSFNGNNLVVAIDEVVNSSMKAGRYTQSMIYASDKVTGSSYL